jgi:hypothetical protein
MTKEGSSRSKKFTINKTEVRCFVNGKDYLYKKIKNGDYHTKPPYLGDSVWVFHS